MARAPRVPGRAVAVLVLGIVGVVFTLGCVIGIVSAIVAVSLAPSARREIRASGGTLGGLGLVTAGAVCGWVAIGLCAAGVLFYLTLFALETLIS